jgi:hypothetical protein
MSIREVKLQAIRVPGGWKIGMNNFYDVDPDIDAFDTRGFNFVKDYLLGTIYFASHFHGLKIDVVWTPEEDEKGHYKMLVIKDDDWINPLEIYESRDRLDITSKIESIMWNASHES